MNALRVAAFFSRHKRLNRVVNRGPVRDWLSRSIWADLEAQPGFNEQMRAAEAEIASGRFYTLDPVTGDTHPNPDWPKDGPQPTHQ